VLAVGVVSVVRMRGVGRVIINIKLTSSHNSDEVAVEVEAHRLVALRAEEDIAVSACGDFRETPGAEHFNHLLIILP